jgi:hypothetical protein
VFQDTGIHGRWKSLHLYLTPHLFLADPNKIYELLLCAPSFSMPSHPVNFPATSSTLPKPDCCGSRFALAAFMASMPACLSDSPDCFQDSPATAPMTDYGTFVSGCDRLWKGCGLVWVPLRRL